MYFVRGVKPTNAAHNLHDSCFDNSETLRQPEFA